MKPSDHNTVRVRENQRRHRAKIKAYINHLENELVEVRSQRDAALERNKILEAEIEALSYGYGSQAMAKEETGNAAERSAGSGMQTTSHSISWSITSANQIQHEERNTVISIHSLTCGKDDTVHHTTPADIRGVEDATGTERMPEVHRERALSLDQEDSDHDTTSTCCGSPGNTSRLSPPAVGCPAEDDPSFRRLVGDPDNLPPPAPGESTILCSVADKIITEQSHDRFNLCSVSSFLSPGFRRPIDPGEGCRVQSSKVFSVLDSLL
jgi:hypothetical protein